MRIKSALTVCLLALAGCQANLQPALEGVGELQHLFELEQAQTRALVASANPQPAVFQAFTAAQDKTRAAYTKVYTAVVQNIASVGAYSPEQVEAILAKVVEIREQLR